MEWWIVAIGSLALVGVVPAMMVMAYALVMGQLLWALRGFTRRSAAWAELRRVLEVEGTGTDLTTETVDGRSVRIVERAVGVGDGKRLVLDILISGLSPQLDLASTSALFGQLVGSADLKIGDPELDFAVAIRGHPLRGAGVARPPGAAPTEEHRDLLFGGGR